MTQRLGQHAGSGLLDPRDARIAEHAWDPPRWSKGDRVMIGRGDDARELLIDATGFDDAALSPFYVVIGAFGVQQFVDQAWLDEHAEPLD